jgi:hypothetical protein
MARLCSCCVRNNSILRLWDFAKSLNKPSNSLAKFLLRPNARPNPLGKLDKPASTTTPLANLAKPASTTNPLAKNNLEQAWELFEDDNAIIEWGSFLVDTPTSSNFEKIFGKQDTFVGRYRTTYGNKNLQLWRIWPVMQILSFCDLRSLKNMSMTSMQFKNAALDILERDSLTKITQYHSP